MNKYNSSRSRVPISIVLFQIKCYAGTTTANPQPPGLAEVSAAFQSRVTLHTSKLRALAGSFQPRILNLPSHFKPSTLPPNRVVHLLFYFF